MRTRIVFAALAAAGALTGCAAHAAAAPSQRPLPVISTPPAASPLPAPSFSDAAACAAFHRAATTGVPASAAGENTLTWLQSQEGDIGPHLQAAIGAYVNDWQQTPPDPNAISRDAAKVRAICAGGNPGA